MPTYIHEYRQATFGVAGQQQRLYCGQHRGQAHTDVVNKACQTAGCRRRASFADGNSAVLKWCVCVCVCVCMRSCVRACVVCATKCVSVPVRACTNSCPLSETTVMPHTQRPRLSRATPHTHTDRGPDKRLQTLLERPRLSRAGHHTSLQQVCTACRWFRSG